MSPVPFLLSKIIPKQHRAKMQTLSLILIGGIKNPNQKMHGKSSGVWLGGDRWRKDALGDLLFQKEAIFFNAIQVLLCEAIKGAWYTDQGEY